MSHEIEAEGEVREGAGDPQARAGEGRGGQEQVLVRDREGPGGHGEGMEDMNADHVLMGASREIEFRQICFKRRILRS